MSKTAFITGASRGIGRAIAVGLCQSGHDVGLFARSRDELDQTAAQCQAYGRRVLCFPGSVDDEPSLAAAIAGCAQTLGRLDVLINNAGIYSPLGVGGDLAELDRIVDVNLRGAIHATHHALPHLLKSGQGSAIFISSFAAQACAMPRLTLYLASKLGLAGFALGLFQDHRHRNLKVSCIYPGLVTTDMAGSITDALMRPETGRVESADMLRPQDVADAVVYAVSSERTACPTEIWLSPQSQPLAPLRAYVEAPSGIDLGARPAPHPVAFIAGASRGIGRDIALALATDGFRLGLLARDPQRLAETAAQCQALGSEALCFPGDINNTQHLHDSIEACAAHFGGLTTLVCNAALNRRKSAAAADVAIWDQVVATNLLSAMHATRSALPHLLLNRRSAIVFISSTAVRSSGQAGLAPYFASKHALRGFSQCVFEDVRAYGVKVSTVCPGLTNTDLGNRPGPVRYAAAADMLQPGDVTAAVRYVLRSSDHACPTEIILQPQKTMLATPFFSTDDAV